MVIVMLALEVILIALFLDRWPIQVNTVVEDVSVPIDCAASAKDLHIAVLLYNWFLALICAVMAFRARSLPANFKEARLISFAMFAFSVIWLSFLIVFSGSIISHFSTYICVAILATALDLVVCMFAPKIFVILFRPELNEVRLVRADIYRYAVKQTNALIRIHQMRNQRTELMRTQLEGLLPRSQPVHIFQES
ncbi:extracellular calcium-sensing receptor-like, partial [Paramuricea clavata]